MDKHQAEQMLQPTVVTAEGIQRRRRKQDTEFIGSLILD